MVKAAIENMENIGNTIGATKIPPILFGQKFDRWKKEVERWSINNKSSKEDEYVKKFEEE